MRLVHLLWKVRLICGAAQRLIVQPKGVLRRMRGSEPPPRQASTGPEVIAPAANPSTARPRPARAGMRYKPQLCCDTGRVIALQTMPPPHMEGDADAILRRALQQSRDWELLGLPRIPMVVTLPRIVAESASLAQPLVWEIDRQNSVTSRIIFSVEAIGTGGASAPGGELAGLALLASHGCGVELSCLDLPQASFLKGSHRLLARMRIPPSLSRQCHASPYQGQVVLSLLALAERHGMASIADSVSTCDEHGFLAQLGCDIVEGDAVAPVLDAQAIAHFLHATAESDLQRLPMPRPAA